MSSVYNKKLNMTRLTLVGIIALLLLVGLTDGSKVAADPDTLLTITTMSWTYDATMGAEATQMSVCVKEVFTDPSLPVILTVASSIPTEKDETSFIGVVTVDNPSCADFGASGSLLPPSDTRQYVVSVFDDSLAIIQRGTANFAFPVSVHQLNCSGTDVVRLNIEGGNPSPTLTAETCGTTDSTTSTCYVVPEQYSKVCATNLDNENLGLEVCLTGREPTPTALSPDAMQAEVLSYASSRLNINNLLVTELLTRGGPDDVFISSPCDGGKCAVSSMEMSDKLYEICGLIYEPPDTITSIASSQFQDLSLTVNGADTPIDFRLANRYSDRKYLVTGTDTEDSIDGNYIPIHLDCTHIPAETYCYGFYNIENIPKYLAVSYDDTPPSNTVISKDVQLQGTMLESDVDDAPKKIAIDRSKA
ncbi:uncharacterized protein LOC108674709 [Hyalella azteca]|uniref:Uncharacterized protein LOC108674709 n=1 Tax=Hyalella azteca TaxID=294128 RepID=A0A8B7NWJ5_HYAAZ|nr:uncharacterized protein LOC108674709 [Hyalella azteca]